MRVYLAGPMSGIPDYNFPAFDEAAANLRAEGFDVFCPADSFGRDGSLPRRVYIRRDLAMLADCDAIAVLPGWQYACGSLLEVLNAIEMGMPVLDAETFRSVPAACCGKNLSECGAGRWAVASLLEGAIAKVESADKPGTWQQS